MPTDAWNLWIDHQASWVLLVLSLSAIYILLGCSGWALAMLEQANKAVDRVTLVGAIMIAWLGCLMLLVGLVDKFTPSMI